MPNAFSWPILARPVIHLGGLVDGVNSKFTLFYVIRYDNRHPPGRVGFRDSPPFDAPEVSENFHVRRHIRKGFLPPTGLPAGVGSPFWFRYVTAYNGYMGMTNAERQARYRENRKGQKPIVRFRRPGDRRSRPQRWADAVEELLTLQQDYQTWLDSLPESLQGGVLEEKLRGVIDIDLSEIENADIPRGFGRD